VRDNTDESTLTRQIRLVLGRLSDVRVQTLLAAFAIGIVLTTVVFGSLAGLVLAVIQMIVAPGSRHPLLPRALGLFVALMLSLPICILLITHTPLSSLPWGHVGELFLAAFVVASLVMFSVILVTVSKRVSPNRTVDPDARGNGARGSP
jgi:ABC-type methionine transport system permease subunit